LILVKQGAAGVRILMGRRSRGHDFMPNKWVFPGGRVDRGDYGAPAASELAPDVAAALAAAVPPGRARSLPRALAMAAVRETYEEAGLLLAAPFASRARARGWSGFLDAGAAPDLAALSFLARAVTPPDLPKRFDACFFTADAARLLSQTRAQGSGELDEIDWFTLEAVERLDLPNVTRFIVGELIQRLADRSRPVLSLRPRRGDRHPAMI
jgi:8-oxo-dGTP pyrophosphatase MutT (NUDIX family)